MIIGLVGAAGSGKDTVAAHLVPAHIVTMNGLQTDIRKRLQASKGIGKGPRPFLPNGAQIALADPMKVFVLSLFDFSVEQLWGESKFRNEPDLRYPRQHALHDVGVSTEITVGKSDICRRCGNDVTNCPRDWSTPRYRMGPCLDHLTPREVLQTLGTEWGRARYRNVWVDNALREAHFLLRTYSDVVISDVRHINEMEAIRREGGELVWVRRSVKEEAFARHESEMETNSLAARHILRTALVLDNSGTLDELRMQVRDLVVRLKTRTRSPKT